MSVWLRFRGLREFALTYSCNTGAVEVGVESVTDVIAVPNEGRSNEPKISRSRPGKWKTGANPLSGLNDRLLQNQKGAQVMAALQVLQTSLQSFREAMQVRATGFLQIISDFCKYETA